jgi:hypothetical protein
MRIARTRGVIDGHETSSVAQSADDDCFHFGDVEFILTRRKPDQATSHQEALGYRRDAPKVGHVPGSTRPTSWSDQPHEFNPVLPVPSVHVVGPPDFVVPSGL